MTPEQLRMARNGLRLSAKELADKGQGAFSYGSVANYEGNNPDKYPKQKTIDAIRATLESLGAIFPPHSDQGQAVVVPIKEPVQIDLEELTGREGD